jgi:hypothetical protein
MKPPKTIVFKVYDGKEFTTFRIPTTGPHPVQAAMQHMIGLLNGLLPEMEWTFVRTGRNQYSVVQQVGEA